MEQVYLDYISELIKRGFYNSRSEYVRVALRDSILKEEIIQQKVTIILSEKTQDLPEYKQYKLSDCEYIRVPRDD